MHLLDNGVCITCTPHVLVDGVCTTCTVARFDPMEPRDPHSGKWTDGPGGAVKDALKLAGRIKLADGERFGGSAKVSDSWGDRSLVLARIDTTSGPKIRLGVVHPEDTGKWRAANGGATVELDERAMRQLREVLGDTPAAGRKAVADYQRQVREAHAANLPRSQWPDTEGEVHSGTIRGDWGDLDWSIDRTEGAASLEGIDYPAGGWSLTLTAAQHGAQSQGNDFTISDSPARVKKLDSTLGNLAEPSSRGSVARFDPLEPRDPHSGKWSGGAVAGDALKLAGRIQLGEGEHLRGSGRLETTSGGDVDILHAILDTPGGAQIRIGVIPADDADRWAAADKGGTAVLSPRSVGHLRDDLADAAKAAKTAARDADKAWARGETPDLSQAVASGVAKGGWADLSWSVHLTDDEPTSWQLSVEPTRGGAPTSSTADAATLTPADTAKLVKQLDGIA